MLNQLKQILYIKYGFVFETDCVFFAVRAETLNLIQGTNFQMIKFLILVLLTGYSKGK